MTVVKGWLFAERRTLDGIVLVAAGVVGDKHHYAYYRVFATARWSLDALGQALFAFFSPVHCKRQFEPSPESAKLELTK